MFGDEAVNVVAGYIEMGAGWTRIVLSTLEQQPQGQTSRPYEVHELGPHRRRPQLPSGEGGPELALSGEESRGNIDAKLIDQIEHPAGGLVRRRSASLPAVAHRAQHHPGWRTHDHRARIWPLNIGTGGQRMACEGTDIVDVQVQMRPATIIDSLGPQVGVAVDRYQRGELIAITSRRRQRASCGRQPEAHRRVERTTGTVNERGNPGNGHAGDSTGPKKVKVTHSTETSTYTNRPSHDTRARPRPSLLGHAEVR